MRHCILPENPPLAHRIKRGGQEAVKALGTDHDGEPNPAAWQ